VATNFLSRWSKRKLEGDQEDQMNSSLSRRHVEDEDLDASEVQQNEQQDTDVSEHADETSVASLLVSEVDKSVKKAALRKLFLSGEFSEVDRLNDYDHDYQSVKSLSSEVAGKLRDWMNSDTEDQIPQAEEPNDEQVLLDNDGNKQTEEIFSQSEESELQGSNQEDMGQNIPHKQ
tara:strand:- start:18 stop:542 length:525 start_codon:yes stop_codon:yes gene_type:complete